jgi:hypothetical protein
MCIAKWCDGWPALCNDAVLDVPFNVALEDGIAGALRVEVSFVLDSDVIGVPAVAVDSPLVCVMAAGKVVEEALRMLSNSSIDAAGSAWFLPSTLWGSFTASSSGVRHVTGK